MPKLGEITEQERMRRRAGLSVTEFAAKVGVSRSYVSQVEGGRRPSPAYARRAAKALRVNVNALFPNLAESAR